MSTAQQNIEALREIRTMMERSSRFISLSGWSGISAGLIALAGAWFANDRITTYYSEYNKATSCPSCLKTDLIIIAAIVFVAAFISAMFFTYQKSRKQGSTIWGPAARRLLWNTLMPMLAGGALILQMMAFGYYELIVPATLLFYGLALVNGSKYTMGEVRYLGYAEILTAVVSMFVVSRGLYLWAFGFGVLHIVYGVAMWWKYERKSPA
jgi:hypothetical protein